MHKIIRITENQLHKIISESVSNILSKQINEDVTFGYDLYSNANMSKLYQSLESTKDTRLSNAYLKWKYTGFDKNTQEYQDYLDKMDYFLNTTLRGMVTSINNKRQRPNTKFNWLLLDPQWMRISIQRGDRDKEIGANEADAKNSGFRCLYTLIATIYNNPCCWNDYCFNPLFKNIRVFVSSLVKEAINLNPQYKQIMPLKELKEINTFKANKNNMNPELFFNPNDMHTIQVNDYEFD